MSYRTPSAREINQGYLTGRTRIINSLSGVLPALVGMPVVLGLWSPMWFTVAWTGTYIAISVFFLTLTALGRSGRLEQAWSITVALLFCGVPISSVVWSELTEHFWAAVVVCIIFIAFEMSTLPFLWIGEWRIGVSCVATTLTVCALLTVSPILAFVFPPLFLAMVYSTDRVRQLRNELQQHLGTAQQAVQHDPLTHLLNRRGLTEAIDGMTGDEITVVFIDVDRFKLINDTHGHQVGDQVLIAFAAELRLRLDDSFHIARLGGDEFVAVARGRVPLSPAISAALPVVVERHGQQRTIECTYSVGVSTGPNVASAHRLLSEAGFAMRDAKRSGSSVSRFGPTLSERLDRTLQIAAIAGGNDDSGWFAPVAQLIISEDEVVGCELLIRWQRPNGESLTPAEFLPLAAEAGLMPAIDSFMLNQAVEFASRFNNRPNAPFVSVNISAPQLGTAGFATQVERLLDDHRVRPERLMIEITETERLSESEDWQSVAAKLRSLGVKLAMDDFGTGYSGLERLHHLPISHLKFDRSLVQAVSGPFGEIVHGVAKFAKAGNIGIIAEGIETLDEIESMCAFDISFFQGFFYHRPEPLDDVERRIISRQTIADHPDEAATTHRSVS